MTRIVGETTRGQMLMGALGSCFFLLAMISFSLFPLFKKHLSHLPQIQEKMVRGLLVPLAIADITHIVLTLLPLPISLLESPAQWTTIIIGNVWITVGLFVIRMSWLLGIGRKPLVFTSGRALGLDSPEKKLATTPTLSDASSSETTGMTPSIGRRTRGRRKPTVAEL